MLLKYYTKSYCANGVQNEDGGKCGRALVLSEKNLDNYTMHREQQVLAFLGKRNWLIRWRRTFILGPFRTFWNTYAISTVGTAICRIDCTGTSSTIGIGELNIHKIRRN